MQTTFSSKVLVFAAAAPIVLALAGCSSDNNPATTDSGASTSSHTSATTTTSGSATTTTSGSATTSSSGAITDAGGDADATTGPLTLTGDVYPNLLHLCVGCHGFTDAGPGGGISAGHLDLGDAAAAYENLVGDGGGVIAQGTPAVGGASCAALGTDAGLKRVMPGDPAHSLLWNKLASNDGDGGSLLLSDGGPEVFCGVPMPLHMGSVGPTNVKMVSDWIEAGAKK